ncbi:MAG TPA: serine/threonine-protein kinase [Streptosporangiaceae bacterium]|nr:serine/threonine-protein kinase [Streptosporangiaceae bacterium]
MTAQDQAPDRLGPYLLLERLGEGGMGVVYLAADSERRKVAVKALRPAIAADPNARRRLAREVETMRRVRSPFVAEIIDADVTSDPPYIVTRYVSGQTLEEVVAGAGPLTGPHLARVASGLALALAAVHAAGVVHRDLKPGNVMLAGGEPVVIDFGIAQVPDSTRLTQTGMFMGTPGYLAPEVIEGKPSGPASDVHSWGATVAFAATGRPPFGTGAFETIFYRIINGQPDLDGFPAPLLALVGQALSRDPARRPDTAELCRRAAALDPSSLVQAAATAPAAGVIPFPPPGTVADRPSSAAPAGPAAGAAAGSAAPPVPPAAWPPSTRPWAVGTGNGSNNSARGARGNGAARPPDSYRDVLPPVQYAPSAPGTARPAREPGAPAGGVATRSPAGPLLVAGSVAAAVAIAVVLPVAGTVAALAVLMGLRAGDQTAGRLSRRRSRRGARASDPLLAAVAFPAALAWSAIRSVLFAPLALAAAALAAVITIIAVPHHPIPVACAFAAGALVAFYGLGPGSGGSRRPIRSFFDSVADTPIRAATAVIAVAAVIIAALVVAASHSPFFWPFSNLGGWLSHFQSVRTLTHDIRNGALRAFGRPSS